jgi:hypothetical protein
VEVYRYLLMMCKSCVKYMPTAAEVDNAKSMSDLMDLFRGAQYWRLVRWLHQVLAGWRDRWGVTYLLTPSISYREKALFAEWCGFIYETLLGVDEARLLWDETKKELLHYWSSNLVDNVEALQAMTSHPHLLRLCDLCIRFGDRYRVYNNSVLKFQYSALLVCASNHPPLLDCLMLNKNWDLAMQAFYLQPFQNDYPYVANIMHEICRRITTQPHSAIWRTRHLSNIFTYYITPQKSPKPPVSLNNNNNNSGGGGGGGGGGQLSNLLRFLDILLRQLDDMITLTKLNGLEGLSRLLLERGADKDFFSSNPDTAHFIAQMTVDLLARGLSWVALGTSASTSTTNINNNNNSNNNNNNNNIASQPSTTITTSTTALSPFPFDARMYLGMWVSWRAVTVQLVQWMYAFPLRERLIEAIVRFLQLFVNLTAIPDLFPATESDAGARLLLQLLHFTLNPALPTSYQQPGISTNFLYPITPTTYQQNVLKVNKYFQPWLLRLLSHVLSISTSSSTAAIPTPSTQVDATMENSVPSNNTNSNTSSVIHAAGIPTQILDILMWMLPDLLGNSAMDLPYFVLLTKVAASTEGEATMMTHSDETGLVAVKLITNTALHILVSDVCRPLAHQLIRDTIPASVRPMLIDQLIEKFVKLFPPQDGVITPPLVGKVFSFLLAFVALQAPSPLVTHPRVQTIASSLTLFKESQAVVTQSFSIPSDRDLFFSLLTLFFLI